jgi:KipI family sensor histidine kinase inhibitor
MRHDGPDVTPFGDAAFLVTFGRDVDPTLNALAHAFAGRVSADRGEAGGPWGVPVPAYASVLVPFDDADVAPATATSRLATLAREVVATTGKAEGAADTADDLDAIIIDVRYGGEQGPDLEEVGRLVGLSPDEVVALHGSVDYRVYFLGFAPGFGYLGPLPEPLRLPRRGTPRVRVPEGSVAIAGAQTAIYPLRTPGGWHLIGRTSAPLWDADRPEPSLLEAGRTVRFRAVVDDAP